jgi:branched-chain amino acid transport system substrate-binding protein
MSGPHPSITQVVRPVDQGIRRRRRTGSLMAVGVVAAMALLVAACSGGTTEESTDVPDGEKVVTIGVVAPVDNGLTDFGRGIANSVRLAVDEANERQAIAGYRIEVEVVDDASDPAVGEAAARQLAANDSVVGVVGPYNSGVAETVAPVLAAESIVMISPANTNPALTRGDSPGDPQRQYDNYFRVIGTDAEQVESLVAYTTGAYNAGTTAVVTDASAVSVGKSQGFADSFVAQGGEVTAFVTLPDDRVSYDLPAVAAEVASGNPDIVFFGGEYDVAVQLSTALSAAGLVVPLVGADGMKDDRYISLAGAASTGDVASTVAVADDAAGVAAFQAAYDAAGFTAPPSDYGPFAYDAANVLIAAAAEALAGSTDGVISEVRQQVIDLVQQTDLTGITGAITFDAFGDIPVGRFIVYRVIDGAWQPVYPEPGT